MNKLAGPPKPSTASPPNPQLPNGAAGSPPNTGGLAVSSGGSTYRPGLKGAVFDLDDDEDETSGAGGLDRRGWVIFAGVLFCQGMAAWYDLDLLVLAFGVMSIFFSTQVISSCFSKELMY